MDLIIGAAKAIAELNGVDKTGHVIDKITEMMFIRETTNACAIAGMKLATEDPPGSGIYFPDYKTGIVTAMNTQLRMPELGLLAGDLAGGSVVTMPSLAELRNPETQKYVEKYLKGATGSAEERMRILKFLQHWVAGLQVMKMWHGGGPIQSHRAALGRQAWPDLEEKKRLAKELIGIKG
jgi:4-hydroxybutyryl-CoA dehydratase/vinylacetyl-CoA-Delta-isomerase